MKGDALAQEGSIDTPSSTLLEFLLVEILEALEVQRRVMGPHLTFRGKHFVEEISGLVFIKKGHERKQGAGSGTSPSSIRGFS